MRLPLTIKPYGVASTCRPTLQDRTGRAFDWRTTARLGIRRRSDFRCAAIRSIVVIIVGSHLERQILVNVQLHSVISKPMKTPRSSTRNHLLSHVRLPAAIPLMGAAAAMACVTLNAPGPVSAQRLNPSITPFPTHSPSPLPSPSPTP
jgi:hypothetical protein